MTPEGKVKAAVKRELQKRKCWYYMPVQNGMGRVGIPDFIVCLDGGRFLAIEVKAPGKKNTLTVNQAKNIDDIRAVRGAAIVVDDANELRRWFDACEVGLA